MWLFVIVRACIGGLKAPFYSYIPRVYNGISFVILLPVCSKKHKTDIP